MTNLRVKVYDGKYEFVIENHQLSILRHGSPWLRDIAGERAIVALVIEFDDLRNQCPQHVLAETLAECRRAALEEAAVAAWMAYMDICAKRNISPSVASDWSVADKIRQLKDA